MTAEEVLFRASSISQIMTEPRSKKECVPFLFDGKEVFLGKTCVSHIHKVCREIKYDRTHDYSNKYIEKGLTQEEEAITLLTLVKGEMYYKNKERFNNEYVSGHPDLFPKLFGKKKEDNKGFDTKVSWDLWTFPYPKDELKPEYKWQNMTYMGLTGADRWVTVYCLVNGLPQHIQKEKMNAYYAMDMPGDDNPEYVARCVEIEKNHIFDMEKFRNDFPGFDFACNPDEWKWDIPREERLWEIVVERDEVAIQAIYDRVKECREYIRMNKLL